MARKSTRRDFLKGRSAADAMADAAQRALPAEEADSRAGKRGARAYLIHVGRRAMACEFEVCLNAGQYPNGMEAALEALDLIETLEAQMTVFRETSEISRINRTAAEGPVEVEPRLFELLELALQLYGQTQRAFDVTSAPLWKLWGFSRRAGTVPEEEPLAEALRCVGSHLVELDPQGKTVRFRQPGVELNLGSIGKGFALDRAAELLAAAGIEDFLFHGGQSSVLARGASTDAAPAAPAAPGGTPGSTPGGWTVGVRHPMRRRQRLAQIRLRDRALATSGSGTQFFRHQGRRYGHILDPRTGRPAEGVLSATVIAPTAAMADALSTAFYVMGPEPALEYCQTRPELAALLICPATRGTGFEIRSAGLEDDELKILSQW